MLPRTADGSNGGGQKMKKILYILMGLAVMAGCKEKPTPKPPVPEETLAEKIVGEWHCVVSDIDADIYLELVSTSTFELYQKIGEGSHRLYRGTWSLNEDTGTLTGKYNDGTSWGSGYAVSISEDQNSMTLTPSEGSEQVFRRGDIPSEIRDNSVIVVKSEDQSPVL